MAKLQLAQIINGANGEKLNLSTADVFDVARKKSVADLIDDIMGQISGATGTEFAQMRTDLDSLKTAFNDFMSGEDNDNGALDRLKELVAAINANKTALDALADKAAKADLDALTTRVATLEGKNWTLLDALATNESSGNLTFNGHELNGETGIAIGASSEAATDYTGKIQIVLQEIEIPETVEA